MDAGDGALVGQGLGVLDRLRQGWKRSASGRGRRSGGLGGLPANNRDDIRAGLTQDLKVLGGLAVLLVELGSIWGGRWEGGRGSEFLDRKREEGERNCKVRKKNSRGEINKTERDGILPRELVCVRHSCNTYLMECKVEVAAVFP